MGEARRRLWKQTYATAKAQGEREKKRVDSAMYVYACAPSMTSHGDVYHRISRKCNLEQARETGVRCTVG